MTATVSDELLRTMEMRRNGKIHQKEIEAAQAAIWMKVMAVWA